MARHFTNLDYQAEVDLLTRLGTRLTGSDQHQELVNHLETRLKDMGYEVHSDEFSFKYMPPFTSPPNLVVDELPIDISSVFPYSGFTSPEGISGQLVKLRGTLSPWSSARGNIAVVEISNPSISFGAIIKVWEGSQPWGLQNNPLLPATIAGASIAKAKASGVQAVIFAWDGTISPAAAVNQYLPFTFDYQNIPVVFTAGNASRRVIEASEQGKTATIALPSAGLEDTSSRTIWAVSEGEKCDETILVVTHTDGINVVEENGHIGVLQLAQDVLAAKPHRTHVFVFVSGHMRIPSVTEHGQATTKWLQDHPEWWRGEHGERKAIAGLVIEHLGAMEYIDDPAEGVLKRTGRPMREILYANTQELATLLSNEWNGMELGQPSISQPSAFIQFGEGEPLSQLSIPNVALVTAPMYLLAAWEGDENELVDLAGMTRQINSFRKLRELAEKMDAEAFGIPIRASPIQYAFQGLSLAMAAGKSWLGLNQ
ncbi:uncharacterized protein BBA_03924 [Beauveria bassiana ARSEF 2860]|uniref:PA domain-containing protein n=1 Tax=Beauveria bassiana (strain ARSEF 2860) TaxID=655819 RepID=J4WB49_BEAB2|nr:uncharacterized protein BBA_03924 [Beauveria bassiana ARSEF 2860]EJP67350.1 hypothetical protein BBA_03924 [Beauveria bassiana ARSEF 2860]